MTNAALGDSRFRRSVVRAMTNGKFLNVRKEEESIMGGKVLETIGEKMFLKGGQVANEKTVVKRLRRLGRHIHLEEKDLQELADDSDMSVERVLSLAKENGIIIV